MQMYVFSRPHLLSVLGAVVLRVVTHSYIPIGIIQPRPRSRSSKASPLAASAGPVIRPTLVGASVFTIAKLWCSSVIVLWKTGQSFLKIWLYHIASSQNKVTQLRQYINHKIRAKHTKYNAPWWHTDILLLAVQCYKFVKLTLHILNDLSHNKSLKNINKTQH